MKFWFVGGCSQRIRFAVMKLTLWLIQAQSDLFCHVTLSNYSACRSWEGHGPPTLTMQLKTIDIAEVVGIEIIGRRIYWKRRWCSVQKC